MVWRLREEGWEEKVVFTDLAVEGARVGDVFLSLVGIHWVGLVGLLGLRGWELYTSEPLGDLRYSVMVSRIRDRNLERGGRYLSGLKVPSVSILSVMIS